jgi:glycosyltransferase involved in cell wall biosynthesis
MKIFGLVPAYNEERNIAEVVRRIKKLGIEPVVVDDASKDRTYELARKTGITVLRHKRNRGKADAIKTGLDYIGRKSYDYVVLIDSDLQYAPEEAPKLLEPLKKGQADFVAGYRTWSKVPHMRHRLGNFVWRTAFNMMFGTNFRDTNCGFVAMNRSAAETISKKLYGGYILENSMFIEAIKSGLRIRQIPVSVYYRHRSAVGRGVRVVAGVLLFILRAGLKHRLRLD